MNIYFLLVTMLPFSSGTGSGAKQLWQQQMKKLDEMIAEYVVKDSAAKQTRRIGLPFFDIGFENDVTQFETTTVHSLRPRDIDIVAAMGDSLSAANGAGATTIAGLALEYRGMCFSVGGDAEVEDSITIPNILKKFNPRVDGYSTGAGVPVIYQQKYGFNVAVPGARADDMFGQARRLIDLLQSDPRSNFESDWKLLTLFIGGNDLCALGRDPDGASPEAYVAEIERALDLLHEEVPKLFVSVVDILDIYLLPYVGYGFGSSRVCRIMQNIFCSHVVNTMNNTKAQDELRAINKQYQVQLQALIDSGKYDTREDFTVVIQPFLRDSVLPYTEFGEVDATYFAPDCFHFSDIGHAMGAINLWNNMLEPVGQKTTVWSITDLKVPTKERPYLFTSKNSLNLPPITTTLSPDTTADVSTTETMIPVWAIVVMATLTVLLAVEALLLVCLAKNGGKRTEDDLNPDSKSVYGNRAVIDDKAKL